jgi:hypothetical protein
MNCEQVKHNLDAFVRGESPFGLTAEIAHHLESCSACREEEAIARKIADGLRGLRRGAPVGLADRIIAQAPVPRKLGWFTPVRAMAATLLVVAALALTQEGRHFFTDEGFREMTVPAVEEQSKTLPPPDALPSSAPPGDASEGAGVLEERAEADASLGTTAPRAVTGGRAPARRVIAPASPAPTPHDGYLKAIAPSASAPPPPAMRPPAPMPATSSAAEVTPTADKELEMDQAESELRMYRADEDGSSAYRMRGASIEPAPTGGAGAATSTSTGRSSESYADDSVSMPASQASRDSAAPSSGAITDSAATDSPARR